MVIVKRNHLTLLLKTMENFNILTGRTLRNHLTGMTKEEKFWAKQLKIEYASGNLKQNTNAKKTQQVRETY